MDNIYKDVINFIFNKIDDQPDVFVWTDGSMILTDIEETWKAMVKTFDLMEMDFTTGTPCEDGEFWYIDFN